MFYQTPSAQSPNEAILIQQNNALFQENSARSQNEQVLFAAWQKSENEKASIINRLNALQTQLENVQKVNADLHVKFAMFEKSSTQNPPTLQKEKELMEYFTDEEELAKETEWVRVKNKKRKMNTSLTPPQDRQKVLENKTIQPKKDPQPPPIIVDGINNFNDIHKLISKSIRGFQIKIINNKNIKINVSDGESYQALTKALLDNEYLWHSFENKQNRPIKVMATRLHHSCNPEEIVSELRKRGYKILEATKKLQYKTKYPLNMFMLSFRHDEDTNKIFEIKDIMGIRVEIQPIKKSKLVPQCKRCQAFGHTQKYCAKEPRCVKCTGKHITAECKKQKETPPKCVHCGEAHPANYRGCMVAKEMQMLKNKQMKKPSLPKQPNRYDQQKIDPIPSKQDNTPKPRTYSQVAFEKPQKQIEKTPSQQNSSVEHTLQLILQKLSKMDDRISKLEYRAQGAMPKSKNGY